jgi:hypothetical protein
MFRTILTSLKIGRSDYLHAYRAESHLLCNVLTSPGFISKVFPDRRKSINDLCTCKQLIIIAQVIRFSFSQIGNDMLKNSCSGAK